MNLDEMRRLDALKTYKELEDSKKTIDDFKLRVKHDFETILKFKAEIELITKKINRLEQSGDHLCAAAAFMGWHDKIEDWNKAKESK